MSKQKDEKPLKGLISEAQTLTQENMQAAYESARQEIPEDWGITLIVAPFGGKSHSGHYVSESPRADMVILLREMADGIEQQKDYPMVDIKREDLKK